jgi:hypothetical protein
MNRYQWAALSDDERRAYTAGVDGQRIITVYVLFYRRGPDAWVPGVYGSLAEAQARVGGEWLRRDSDRWVNGDDYQITAWPVGLPPINREATT